MDLHDTTAESLSEILWSHPTLRHSNEDSGCSMMVQMVVAHAADITYGRIQIPGAQDSKNTCGNGNLLVEFVV